jgi:hypothetical protein
MKCVPGESPVDGHRVDLLEHLGGGADVNEVGSTKDHDLDWGSGYCVRKSRMAAAHGGARADGFVANVGGSKSKFVVTAMGRGADGGSA